VLVQTYRDAKAKLGTQPHHWHPTTRESADHSIPYVVSAVLVDGEASFEMFDDAHLADPTIRAVLSTVEVVADDGFTRDYDNPPFLHRTRVTVTTTDGAAATGETGGEHGEIGAEMSDEDVTTKFRSLTRRHLSPEAAERLLATVWDLDGVADVAVIPPLMRVTATPV
jgi:2-methylcitrate dehydratase